LGKKYLFASLPPIFPLDNHIFTYYCVKIYVIITCERRDYMPTNLAIDEALLKEAQKIGKHKTKKNTVNEALKEYIMKRKQKNILSLFGKVDIEPSYDYKKERKAR
jgi:hypothetical protein